MTDIKSYLPEFDDFILFKRHHNRVKRFKNKPAQKGITFEIAEDWFVQFICQYYLHHGIDFLREQIDQKIESIKYREVVNDYINKAEAYKE